MFGELLENVVPEHKVQIFIHWLFFTARKVVPLGTQSYWKGLEGSGPDSSITLFARLLAALGDARTKMRIGRPSRSMAKKGDEWAN